MANCQSSNERVFGSATVLELAHGCPDSRPAEIDWKALGAGTTKGISLSPNSVTSDADDTGGWVENIITNADMTFSFDGEVRKHDKLDQFGYANLFKYFTDEVSAKRQPTLWARMTIGPLEFSGYMVISDATPADGGSNDIITFSVEFKVSDGTTVKVENLDAPVTVPLAFTKNLPATKTADEDNDVVWDVEVTGGRVPYSFAWYYGSVLINPAINPTAATATLVNRAVTSASAGSYHCVVTDKTGATITSATSVLTVN
ncbi:hypothetical protein QN007_003408 [Escherichia coli]|nr:hypothetical protein [Escherichia coli]